MGSVVAEKRAEMAQFEGSHTLDGELVQAVHAWRGHAELVGCIAHLSRTVTQGVRADWWRMMISVPNSSGRMQKQAGRLTRFPAVDNGAPPTLFFFYFTFWGPSGS